MTVCNMSIEAGAKAGLIAPDDTTFAYLEGRAHAPKGDAWDARSTTGEPWPPTTARPSTRRSCSTARRSRPHVSWGTNPAQVVPIDGAVPDPDVVRRSERTGGRRPGPRVHGAHRRYPDARHQGRHGVHRVVHQQPHRGPAGRRRGRRGPAGGRRRPHPRRARVSFAVKHQAEREGLDEVFRAAGFDWREPGCSMCLAMNPDKLAPGERSASTSQPQLRGPPGPRRPHPPRVAGGGRGHRHRRHLRHPGGPLMDPVRIVSGTAVPLDRSDVDTDQIIPRRVAQAGRAHRLRPGPVRVVARRPVLRAQRRALRRRPHPRGRTQLRHRLVP